MTSLALGCGSEPEDNPTTSVGISNTLPTGADDLTTDTSDDSDPTGPDKLDVAGGETGQEMGGDAGDGDCGPEHLPTPNATVTGTVFAPNLQIPISGALVYLIDEDPEPVPDGVYCAECVELPCDVHYVLSEADGSFMLPAVAGSGQKLVVQKGQFLHVTDFDVAEGSQAVPAVDSSLPNEWNPAAGHWIPRIAVFDTSWDAIHSLLAKIGLGQVDQFGELIPGTEQFDYLDPFTSNWVLDDLNTMMDYHIIFIPCMSQGGLGYPGGQRLDNIRAWTEMGGKWYVTDWANEYLYEPFPNYQDFHSVFDPDLGVYESHGLITDAGLLDWLEALPAPLKDIGGGAPTLNTLPGVTLEDNWSGLDAIHDIIVQDENGEDVNVGHHEWVRGPCGACSDTVTHRPMTVSGGYGCGRMMFSTYHTTEYAHLGLTPQELVLLYIILEIGVCHGEPPPPPPPIE